MANEKKEQEFKKELGWVLWGVVIAFGVQVIYDSVRNPFLGVIMVCVLILIILLVFGKKKSSPTTTPTKKECLTLQHPPSTTQIYTGGLYLPRIGVEFNRRGQYVPVCSFKVQFKLIWFHGNRTVQTVKLSFNR